MLVDQVEDAASFNDRLIESVILTFQFHYSNKITRLKMQSLKSIYRFVATLMCRLSNHKSSQLMEQTYKLVEAFCPNLYPSFSVFWLDLLFNRFFLSFYLGKSSL